MRFDTIRVVRQQAKRAEQSAIKNRLSTAVAGAGSIAVAECFDGTASNLTTAALAGIAIYSALKSVHAGQVDAALRQSTIEAASNMASE